MPLISFSRGQIVQGASLYLDVKPNAITVRAFAPEKLDPGAKPFDGGEIHESLAEIQMVGQPSRVFTLADLRSRPDWADYSIWAIPMYPDTKRLKAPVNCWAESFISKQRSNAMSERIGESKMLYIFVPHRNATFDEMGFHAHIHTAGSFVCPKKHIEQDVMVTRAAVMPQLAISGPDKIDAAGSFVNFTVSLNQSNPVECHLEVDAGYLPKRRVPVVDGTGQFKLSAFGLSAGDRIKIKAGFKFFSGAAEKTVTVG